MTSSEKMISFIISTILVIGLIGVLAYTELKPMDEDTSKMFVYNLGPNRTDDCTFLTHEVDIFWTDVYMGCKESALPKKMNNYTLRYVSDNNKHYVLNKSNKWCHDITGKYSYTPCSKIFAYRKYFYEE